MTTRDAYVALLEKRATDGTDVLHDSIPANDSAEAAAQEHRQNQTDERAYLHATFSQAGNVQSNQSSEIKKLFSNLPSNTVVSHPLIKIASRETFFRVLGQGNFLKTASPIHREVAYNSFLDELEKISSRV